jgi:hypothetical protein
MRRDQREGSGSYIDCDGGGICHNPSTTRRLNDADAPVGMTTEECRRGSESSGAEAFLGIA